MNFGLSVAELQTTIVRERDATTAFTDAAVGFIVILASTRWGPTLTRLRLMRTVSLPLRAFLADSVLTRRLSR